MADVIAVGVIEARPPEPGDVHHGGAVTRTEEH